MAVEASRSSTSSADSYIGSLISLTSKSEIRYEGILYNINTDESSIGLRNGKPIHSNFNAKQANEDTEVFRSTSLVSSFGSEGRKKDGPQIMPSDKVYEYILFRGSDIKDLQVKSSPPVQPTQASQPINSDPAIIQSHYPRPPAATGNSIPDSSTHNPQLGHPGSTFPGGMPLYQPDGSMGPWGPSPTQPNVNSNGFPMPMYWPGFYGPPNGLPQLHQQPLFRPTPMQYPSFNSSLPSGAPVSNLPDYSSPLLPPSTSSVSLLGSTLPSSLPPVPPSLLNTEPLPNLMQTKVPNSVGPTAPVSGSLPSVSPLTTSPDINLTIPPILNKSNVISGANVPYQGVSRPTESPTPSLVTPGQLLQSTAVSSQSSQTVYKDVEPKPTPTPSSKPSVPVSVPTEAQPPILPLPTQTRNAPKTNGAPYQNRNSYGGRERGRGSGNSQPVMKFTEEFDFTAMNEKFNKDEVWGTLGKTNKFNSKDQDGNVSYENELEDENDAALPKIDVKPVYIKDDFFDTLSCNSSENRSNNVRTRFSEQMKLDTETFGEFSRYRGGRGGRGPYRGGHSRGRGYHGRGYGYVNRGRGGRIPTRDY